MRSQFQMEKSYYSGNHKKSFTGIHHLWQIASRIALLLPGNVKGTWSRIGQSMQAQQILIKQNSSVLGVNIFE